MALRTNGKLLYGDWRSSAHGSARRTHLYTAGRQTACGARVAYAKTGSRRSADLNDVCYECLAYGAAGHTYR